MSTDNRKLVSENRTSATVARSGNIFASPSFWALAVAVIIFPLIWAGGLVTTTDAGMAVPDWPGTYGYNLLLYPISTWLSGPFDLFVEHGHRLLGALVGLLAIFLVASTFLAKSPRATKAWASLLLLAIVLQGLLGGVRVLFSDRALALVHGCTGPLVFVLASYLVIRTKRDLAGKPAKTANLSAGELSKQGLGYARFAGFVTVLAIVQLIIGAFLRHVDLSFSPMGFMGLTHLHLTFATLLMISVCIIFASSWSRPMRQSPSRHRPAALLFLLILTQIALGLMTWFVNYGLPWSSASPTLAAHVNQLKGFWETMIVTGHQAVGSLILVTSFVLASRSWYAFRHTDVAFD